MNKSRAGIGLLLLIQACAVALESGRETVESRIHRQPEYHPMVEQSLSWDSSSDHTLIRNRYIRFLTVTESTFAGKLGAEAQSGRRWDVNP